MAQTHSFRYAVLPIAIATAWTGWFFWTKAPHWIAQQTDRDFLALQASTELTTARVLKVSDTLVGGGYGYAIEYCSLVSFADRQGLLHRTDAPCVLNDKPTQGSVINIRYQPETAEVVWTEASEASSRFNSSLVSLGSKIIGALCFMGAVGLLKAAQSDP